MSKLKRASLSLLAGIALMPAAHAFNINLTGTSLSGLPVSVTIDLVPETLMAMDDVAADGTLHQRTLGNNAMSTLAWFLDEAGGKSFGAANDRNNFFLIDAYLRPDGSSQLILDLTENSRYHSAYQDTELRFTLTSANGSLYTSAITEETFAHYDAIEDGQALRIDRYFSYLPDGSVTEDVQSKVVRFSSTAVPEPTSVALVLAGGVALCAWRRMKARAVQ